MCFGNFNTSIKVRQAFKRNKGEFVCLEPGGILAESTILFQICLDSAFGFMILLGFLSYLKKRQKKAKKEPLLRLLRTKRPVKKEHFTFSTYINKQSSQVETPSFSTRTFQIK